MPLTRVRSQLISVPTNYPITGSLSGTASYATTASFAMNGSGTSLVTGSVYPITSSWANNSISSSYSLTSTTSSYVANAVSSSYSLTSSYALTAGSGGGTSLVTGSNYPITSSWSNNSLTASYVVTAQTASYYGGSVISSSYALSASYAPGGGGGTTLTTGSTYPITSSWSNNAITASYAINSVSIITSSLQTGSITNQTILYNVTTSQDNIITGLNLINNKWDVSVIEEWNSASVVGDAYYSSCSVLFHFSGSNGSTSIIDNGPNNVTSTVSGATVITSSFSKFGSSSLFLGGTNGNYLTIPVVSGGPLDVNNQDFTVECYIYITATTNGEIVTRYNSNAGSGNYNWDFSIANGKLQSLISQYNNNNSYNLIAGATSVTTGSWHHVAFVRSSSFQTLFLDGNKDASGSITVTTSDSSQAIRIGTSINANGSTNAPIVGYMDELRITKGIARYTVNFNTSSLEFPNTSGSLQLQTKYIGLVGGLNDSTVDYGVEKLSDSSLKIRKMSASGQPLSGSGTLSASVDRVYVNVLSYDNISVSPTSSYAITASYAMNGGGGGGSTSLTGITFPYVSGSNTYTLSQSVVAANDLLLSVNGVVQTPTTDYTVSSSTVTFTDSYPSGSSVNVRYLVSATSSSFVNLNNIVLTGTTTGDAYYPQVSALLHFDGVNGSTVITDNSKNVLTVTSSNGAAISTAQSKFGGASCFFDGTDDYLSISSPTPGFSFGTGDFTIEMWVYKTSASSIVVLVEARVANTATPWDVAIDASNFPYLYDGTNTLTSNIAVTLNSWVHLAWVRTSGVLKIFVNGVQGYSAAHSVNLDRTAGVLIGKHIANVFYYNGYIDELRITNGYARYTSNFTPSTTAFADGGGDVGKALVVNSTATGVSIGTAGFNLNSSNINRIINGAMAVDQRNAGAAQTITAAAALAYTVDRWYAYCTGANVTGQRVAGTGNNQFAYRFTGAASVTAIGFGQRIEAANSIDLAGSTATLGVDLANSLLTSVTWTAYYANTADTFGTLASPTRTQIATGTFTVTSTLTRYSAQIFIPSAAITGLEIVFSVGAQTSGTWTIDNVQLEAGPLATPFERRLIGQELINCQRYFASINGFIGAGSELNTSAAYIKLPLSVTMRADNQTVTLSTGNSITINLFGVGTSTTSTSNVTITANRAGIGFNVSSLSPSQGATGVPAEIVGTVSVSSEL